MKKEIKEEKKSKKRKKREFLTLQKRAETVKKCRSTDRTFVLKLLGTGVPGPALPILEMASEKLFWNVVLNYATRTSKPVCSDDIMTNTHTFFGIDSSMAAKELVWTHANLATRITSRETLPKTW